MIEESKKILEELRMVEEELSLPETMADPKRFRELGRRHARLSKIAAVARDYLKLREDVEEWLRGRTFRTTTEETTRRASGRAA